MKIDTLEYSTDWTINQDQISDKDLTDIVFLFGDSEALRASAAFDQLRARYPRAHLVGASSAGHILGDEIKHCAIVATAVQLEKSSLEIATVDFQPGDDTRELARQLGTQLPQQGLRHVFVLSDGLNINGSDLVEGLNQSFPGIPVTGGMAGDGDRFEITSVVADDLARSLRIVAVGFYGENLLISHGCYAGWSDFGGNRVITRSQGNVLYELDHAPALDLYKKYLGEYAEELPLSGMRFPLSIRPEPHAPEVIRTLLAINEEEKSITFGGNMPQGHLARLMRPNLDVLIDGAKQAAEDIDQNGLGPALGLVVSCTGRKLVMSQLVEEELEVVREVLGDRVQLVGFYSYGEIAPFQGKNSLCELHNQTMTLTGIYET